MALTPLEIIAPVAAGIITSIGTILTLRWQEVSKRTKDERDNQIMLLDKVDALVDERLAEARADRTEIKEQLRQANQERNFLFEDQSKLKEKNALLQSQINEIQLQREQAINRMRRELNSAIDKNTGLFAKNAELETQLDGLRQENHLLRQQLPNVQQQPN